MGGMRRLGIMLACALALALGGCGGGATGARPERAKRLRESLRPMVPRSPASVKVYREGQVPGAGYIDVYEIAELGETAPIALERLRRSAADLGCDGLIVSDTEVGAAPTGINLTGTCIMFLLDPMTWQPPDPQDVCAAGRAKLLAAKDPARRAQIARELPPECHRR